MLTAMKAKGQRRKAVRMGRPPGSGGPPESVRRNRVVVMLTDAELATLRRLAESRELPLGTMLYQLVNRSVRAKK